jgi:hypothetical protein
VRDPRTRVGRSVEQGLSWIRASGPVLRPSDHPKAIRLHFRESRHVTMERFKARPLIFDYSRDHEDSALKASQIGSQGRTRTC